MEGDLSQRDVHYDHEPLPDGTRVDLRGLVDDTVPVLNPAGDYQIVHTEPMPASRRWYRVTVRRVTSD
jgi:hypothetical protein